MVAGSNPVLGSILEDHTNYCTLMRMREVRMFNDLYNKVRNRLKYFNSQPEVYEVIVDDDFEYTDEIEKALWDIKECLDLPTEEIEIAIATRHSSLKKS